MSRFLAPRSTDSGFRGRAGQLVHSGVSLAHGSLGAYFGIGSAFHEQAAGQRVDPGGLAGYYCDFSHKVAPRERREGHWLATVLEGGPSDWPMMVAQGALGLWERHLAGEPVSDEFVALADWLVDNAQPVGSGTGWRHNVDVPKYEVSAGWISGMTQGEGISVLLRAEALTGQARYRDAAIGAFEPFRMSVSDGGVTCELDGALVLEEYPTRSPTAVLNGWIFGLLGLHELRVATGNPEVAETFRRTHQGLLSLLNRYDVGWWSRYSLRDHGSPDLAKPFYQQLHVVLLDAVNLVEPDARLGAMARRWEHQITRPAMARIAANKVSFRIHRGRSWARA